MNARELVEQGIRAYTRGALDEAERLWTRALMVDPRDDRARSYLGVLVARRGAVRRDLTAVPLPAPSPRATPPALPASAAAAAGRRAPPVPLPAKPTSPQGPVPPTSGPPEAPAPPSAASGTRSAAGGRPPPTDAVPSPWDEGPALGPAVVLQDGDGLDLATVEEKSGLRPLVPEPPATARPGARPRSDVEVWMESARERFALGDFSGSLEMIEKILKVDPGHTEARLYLEQNEATLTSMYESKLGPQDAIPRLAIKPEEVMWLNLDHRAGFLLAQIDGTVSYEDLFAVSGLPRLDTARILAGLLQEGVIK